MKNKVSKKTNKHRRITKRKIQRKGKFNLSGGALNLERLNKVLENFDGFVWDFDGTIVTNIVHNRRALSLDTSQPVLDQINSDVRSFFFQPTEFVELVNFLVYNGKTVGIISFGSIRNILHILKKLFSSYGYGCPFSYNNVKGSPTMNPLSEKIRDNKKVNFINNFAREKRLNNNRILFFDDDNENAEAVSKNGFKGISLIGNIASQLRDYNLSTYIKTPGFSVDILYLINALLNNNKGFDSNLLIKAPKEILEEQSSQKLKKSKKKSKKTLKVKSYNNKDPYTKEPIFNTIEEAKKRNEIRKTKKKGLAGLAQRLYRFVTKRRQPEAPASPPTNKSSAPASPPTTEPSAPALPPQRVRTAPSLPPTNEQSAPALPPPRKSAAPALPPPRKSAAPALPPTNEPSAPALPPQRVRTVPASPPTTEPQIVYEENTPSVLKLKKEAQERIENEKAKLYTSVKRNPHSVVTKSERMALASNRHRPTNSNRKRLDEQAMEEQRSLVELQKHFNESENSTNENRVSSGEIKEIQSALTNGLQQTTSNPRKSQHPNKSSISKSKYNPHKLHNTNPFKKAAIAEEEEEEA